MEISEKIKKIRNLTNLNQSEFGNEIGVNQRTISNWESARNEPSLIMLQNICKRWDISPIWLILGEGDITFQDEQLYFEAKKYAISNNRLNEFNELLVGFIGKQTTVSVIVSQIEKIKGQKVLEKISESWSGKGERMLRVLDEYLKYLQTQNISFSPENIKIDFINSLQTFELSKEFKIKYLWTTTENDKNNLIKWIEAEIDEATIFEIMSLIPALREELKKQMNVFDKLLNKLAK